MIQSHSYHKGVILWVDDNFINNPFQKDIDVWDNLFGSQSDKVYRLMNLELRVATSYENGMQAVEELARLQNQGVYVICVLDIYMPRNEATKDVLSSDNGMRLAKYVQEKGLHFVFLSTASDISPLLLDYGLTSVPFYQKLKGDKKMPDTLTQYILRNFRININWVNLEETIHELSDGSLIPLLTEEPNKRDKLSIRYFPFFDSYKEYVERWEYYPPLKKGSIMITRCPEAHGNDFIQQCLLLAISDLVLKYPGHVLFRFLTTKDSFFKDHLIHSPQDKFVINAIRIFPENTSSEEFSKLIKEIPTSNNVVIFILPNNESSDQYLNRIFTSRAIIYDELPDILIGNTYSRENLIRKSITLILQNLDIKFEDVNQKLGDGYLLQPELLVHPLSWVILLDPVHVAELLSDPFEILYEVEMSIGHFIKDIKEADAKKLIDNQPLNSTEALKIGFNSLKRDKNIEFEKLLASQWIPFTLEIWLSKSWQFPYGLNLEFSRHNIKNLIATRHLWNNYAFDILTDLIGKYKLQKDFPSLNQVFDFFNLVAIKKLLAGTPDEINDDEWGELRASRWPYHDFPFPSILSKMLKESGHYLWIESDNYNYAQIFQSTRNKHNFNNDFINQFNERVIHLQSQLEYLPIEWSYYIKYFIDLTISSKIQFCWKDKSHRQLVYDNLIDFLNNALPVYYLSSMIWAGKFSNDKDASEVYEDLYHCTGYGKLINKIAGFRNKNLFKFITPSVHHQFTKAQREAYQSIKKSLQINYYQKEKDVLNNFIDKLVENNLLSKIFSNLDNEGRERVSKILKSAAPDPQKFPVILKKIADDETKIELFQILGKRDELNNLNGSNHAGDLNDIWDISNKYLIQLEKIVVHGDGQIQDKSYNGFLGNLSEFNKKYQALKNYEFGSAPFDVFMNSLDYLEDVKIVLSKLNHSDGFIFIDQVRWLRNKGKETVPSNIDVSEIEKIFESFCFCADAFAAQIKFLLNLSGENELADRIKLKYVDEIKLPENVQIPGRNVLDKFITVHKESEGYYIYHLGIPGDDAKGKKMIRYKKKNAELA